MDHGVHAIIVPIRDQNGSVLPGVEIHDCGQKVCGKAGQSRAGRLATVWVSV